MYEEFYGLKDKPFSKTPDPRFLYQGRAHREALARMEHAVDERELMVLTGDIGTGKTTLSRALIDSLNDSYKPILIINPILSPSQLLRAIARAIDIKEPSQFKPDLLEQIYNALFSIHKDGISPVIIIDEAHLIPGRNTFEELRLLTNLQLDDTNLFSLILIGQPELRKRLSSDRYRAFRQRIGIHYHIPPLTQKETREYIEFRLMAAGGERSIFKRDAVKEIFRLSKGIPRLINNLAHYSLIEGFSRDSKRIDSDIVLHVARDLGSWVVKERKTH